MVEWRNVRLDLMDDIKVLRSNSALRYNSATPHCPWSRVEGANVLLSSGDYYQLDGKCDEAVHYRRLRPDWSTFKEWLRVHFNELEIHELDPNKYPVYQIILGILIEGGSVEQVQGDIWFEMSESATNSFRERILLDLWEEIDRHGFPREQRDD